MAEKFRLHQRRRHRRAVHGDKRPRAARAVLVNRLGYQLLTRAGFAQNQHGGKRLPGAADQFKHALHSRGFFR